MRTLLAVVVSWALVISPQAALAAGENLQVKVVEQFNENCSAVLLTLITRQDPQTLIPNLLLRKGQRSGFIRLDAFTDFNNDLLHGQMVWDCGDTEEAAACDASATHVRVQRSRTGRATTFTCYKIESCVASELTLDKLDDRCHAESLKVGGRLIHWLETKKDIPFADAKLNNSGGVRWVCGGSNERSNCPSGTSLLTVERQDRDTGRFHITCQRAGGQQCERYDGEYPPK